MTELSESEVAAYRRAAQEDYDSDGRIVVTLCDTIDAMRAKIERLESRGIEDMRHRIAELEGQLETETNPDSLGSQAWAAKLLKQRAEIAEDRIAELEAEIAKLKPEPAGFVRDWRDEH